MEEREEINFHIIFPVECMEFFEKIDMLQVGFDLILVGFDMIQVRFDLIQVGFDPI